MLDIAIVLGCNLHWAPYYYNYESIILKKFNHFDLIVWNRENIVEDVQANKIEFKEYDKTADGGFTKIVKYYRFSNFVKDRLTLKHYDRIFFLGTYACVPALLSNFLNKNYLGKYWVDVRDYQFENIIPYKILEKKVLLNARYVSISSEYFKAFLPKRDYLLFHNIDPMMDKIEKNFNKSASNKIRISYIGHVGWLEESKEVLNTFANDERFIIQYYGKGSETLQQYCQENSIRNVDFCGQFPREKTMALYEKTDIINNIYGNDNIHVRTALSNKLYYSLFLNIPIMVCSNTAMEEFGNKYGISITFENSKQFPDKLFIWYKNFIGNNNHHFSDARNMVLLQNTETAQKIEEFIAE